MNTPGLNPTYPVILIAPINHKTKNNPPIKAKAKPKPISISLALSLTDNPIDIRGFLSINLVATHNAAKLPRSENPVKINITGESKLISLNKASAESGFAISTPEAIIINTTPIDCTKPMIINHNGIKIIALKNPFFILGSILFSFIYRFTIFVFYYLN